MPKGDKTGSKDKGRKTDKAAGYRAGDPGPGFAPTPGRGRNWGHGWGHGRDRGRGWRHRCGAGWGVNPYTAPFAPELAHEQEVEMLKQQAEYLNKALEAISTRIRELETAEAAQKEE